MGAALREIVVDNFAGGGGASTGIELATGRSVDIAINHDEDAIAMHQVNHPDTEHYCESVWDVNPVEAVKGRPVALCWLSPDCKHFSKAKGGKPKEKSIRGLAWVALRWAATAKPRVIILENVEEFKTWGPLLKDGRPDPKKKGHTFNSFVNALKRQGYQVDWRELRACEYGAPTIRKRFFMIARCDGRPIVWPKPTHGDPRSLEVQAGRLEPWRPVAEVIDWAIQPPSIFERKRPLKENTMHRIGRGIGKFVVEPEVSFLAPIPVKSKDHKIRVAAFLAQYHTETTANEARGQALDKPIMTLDTSNRYALVTVYFAENQIEQSNHVKAFLMKYYGSDTGQSCKEPLHTITTVDRFGLVTVHYQNNRITDIGMRMLEPHELFAAQGFPSEYIIDRDIHGKPQTKKSKVARCGNSVPPPFAKHLVKANLPELCAGSGRELKFERYKQAAGQMSFSM
ncbi:DNA cytosine methyltransferase [Brevibacillus laterosporus]|uniref:DNA cytosine methyltransferase n=1 Tax=Brevibacillus laterosporus TaxID=1465 RepID=UPI00215BF623|nr:DNA cytosine methyltransferase [Brevibacillus laterosporus]MCR8994502.1 DNA cytosine methyltransferase [Brevibacillus laterosporus]